MIDRYIPDMHVSRIVDIPLDELKSKGIKGLLFDVDNTLTAWHSQDVAPEVVAWLADLPQQDFSPCILSNSYDGRVRPLAEKVGLPFICNAKKPTKAGFLAACKKLSLTPSQVAMVGDQLLTDVGGANAVGLFTICVDIIDPREYWFTRFFSRRVEKNIRKKLAK